MQSDQIAVLVLLVGLVAGCTGSGTSVSYNRSSNQTTYETDDIIVARDIAEEQSGNTPLRMKVVAYCRGRHCTPRGGRLFFFVEGNGNMSFPENTLTLQADGKSFSWSNWRTQPGNARRDGYIVQVSVSLSTLERFARAASFSGSLNNTQLDLGEPVQSMLYEFVQTARTPGQ